MDVIGVWKVEVSNDECVTDVWWWEVFVNCVECAFDSSWWPIGWEVQVDYGNESGIGINVCDHNTSRYKFSGPYVVVWWEPLFFNCRDETTMCVGSAVGMYYVVTVSEVGVQCYDVVVLCVCFL